MKKIFAYSLLTFVVALSGCKNSCKDLTTQVLQPTSAAESLIAAYQNGSDVANGCPALLTTLKTIPDGAQTLRYIAENKFTDSYSTCVRYETATRWEYQCWGGPHHQVCRAYPYTYTYCVEYEHHTTHDNGYTQAMDLSAHLDVMFDKANQMCGDANAGKLDAALNEAHELSNYITYTIKAESDQVYALACSE